MRRLLLIVFLIGFTALPTNATQQSEKPNLDAALAKLELGIELLERREPNAKQTIREAAADIEHVIDAQGLRTSGAYHALGNAYMLCNDYGLAVLAFRRGEQITPTDPRLRDSLMHAREQVAISVTPSTTNRVISLLMSWRGVLPRGVLWMIGISSFTLAWLMLISKTLFAAPSWFRTTAFWLLGLSLIPFAALGAEWRLYVDRDDAVLVQSNTIARAGPDDSIYDAVYSEPLDAGTEGVIAEQRDNWSRMILADGSECWVRTDAVLLINP